ncbi:unnamed protein product, partial [Laminaria digitata]
MTPDETDRLQVLQAAGGDCDELRAEVTVRTMSDGSFARKFFQPGNLNPALPPTEFWKTRGVLKRIISGDPKDRPTM